MSLYPNILHTSTYNSMLAQHPQPHPQPAPEPPNPPQQHHHHEHTDHHISSTLSTLVTHLFTPTAHLQCTCSTPIWASSPPSSPRARPQLLPDDDMVLLVQAGQDGAPLCREAGIEGWKTRTEGKDEAGKSRRRRSIEWLAGVISREGGGA